MTTTAASTVKPTLALVLGSWLVIGAFVALASGSVASFFQTWDLCVFATGLVLLPPSVLMAVLQYAATFRRNRTAAMVSGILLFLMGGFAVFGVLANWAEAGFSGEYLPLWLILPGSAISGFCLYFSRLNIQWYQRLDGQGRDSRPLTHLSLAELLGLVTVIGVSMGLVNYLVRTTPPQFAEHLETSEPPFKIPAGARDISFCQAGRGNLAYEFTIDEPRFLRWMEDRVMVRSGLGSEAKLEPIAGAVQISTYRDLMPNRGPVQRIMVLQGSTYVHNGPGRWIRATYDREAQRAYFESFDD